MYPVSTDYKTDINKTLRNLSYIKVTIDMVDHDVVSTNTTTDNGHVSFSDVAGTDIGDSPTKTYSTMEHNRLVLNGQQVLPPEVGATIDYYQGFVSNDISDSNGAFLTNPKITTVFADYVSFIGMAFKFDDIMNCYPTELDIICYDGDTVVETTTHTPTLTTFITPLGVPSSTVCNKIEVVFKGTSIPKRKVRVGYMVFGIIKEWTDSTINKAVLKRNVDLLSTKMPINSFEFTAIDMNPTTKLPEYDLDNPTGFWQYIEQKQAVKVIYGYELDNGGIEWMTGANLYTTGEIKSNSSGGISTITFYANAILNQLTNIYYKGKYNVVPVTLYSLAQEVLTDANIPNLADGSTPYFIDTALQSISTSCPLPKLPINQVLQLIANAGRCVIYVDRNGVLTIKRFADILQDFELNFSNMTSVPKITKNPPLYTVTTNYNTVAPETAESSLAKVSLSYGTNTQCVITYDDAVADRYTVTGTLSVVGSPEYYATCCVITVTGIGDLEIFGHKLTQTKTTVIHTEGVEGYDCPIENMLINTLTDAQNYSSWVADILKLRNSYSVEERGYPEIDMLDVVTTQSLFTEALEVIITGNNLTYNGALSAQTSFIAKEV